MPTRMLFIVIVALLGSSCGGGDKHLPSSNPPEYDPKKVYTSPVSPPIPSVASPAKPASPPSPPTVTDPAALRKALEATDRMRAMFEKVESLDPNAQIHALLEAVLMGEQAPPELRPTFKELFEPRKAKIHQAFDKELGQLRRAINPQSKNPAVHPRMGGVDGSGPFSLYRVSTRYNEPAMVPSIRLIQFGPPPGVTMTVEPDCCGEWSFSSKSDAYSGDGFSVGFDLLGRYNPEHGKYVGMGDAVGATIKVAIGEKAKIQVKFSKKERAVVKRCPSALGVVPGDVYSYDNAGYQVSSATTNTNQGSSIHDQAKTVAQTDEDGVIQEVRMEVTAADLDAESGQPLRQMSAQVVFNLHGGQVSCSAGSGGCEERMNRAAKRLKGLVARAYYEAESQWNDLDSNSRYDPCVKIHFTPPTKTKALNPGQSTKVKAELQTVVEDEATEGRLFEVEDHNDGTATPKDTKTSPGSPAVFTFTAPKKQWKEKSDAPGFVIRNSASRAGRARREYWELTLGLRLRIHHRIQDDPASMQAKVGQALFDGEVHFDVSLEPAGGGFEGWYRGILSMVRPIRVGHRDGPLQSCSGAGSQVENWDIRAFVDAKANSMQLKFGMHPSNQKGAWTCKFPDGTVTDTVLVDVFSELEFLAMPANTGVSKEVNLTHAGGDRREWISVTVVEGTD